MGSIYKPKNNSDIAFAREIIKHNPRLRNRDSAYKKAILEQAEWGDYRGETGMENAIAQVGKFKRNSAPIGDDFLHGQGEVKTCSLLRVNTTSRKQMKLGRKPSWAYQANVKGLEHKTGPLRLAVYHPKHDTIYYFFILATKWKRMVNKSGGLVVKRNRRLGTFGRLEEFRTDFKGLCQPV